MHLRLGEVEAGLVGVIEVGHVGVGDVDVRGDFLVDQLVDGEIAPDLGPQIVQRHVAVGELLFEFLLGIGRLHLVEFGVDVGVHRRQAQLFRPLQHDFVGDQAAQQVQLLRHHLVLVGGLGCCGYCDS